MAFKNTGHKQLNFSDLAIINSIKKNRTYEMLNKLESIISWEKIKRILEKHYKTGQSDEGALAFHPLVLFKALLLQKWFKISSDPELESQINDRISFKKFLGISMNELSPDHSTFSRFRSRLSKQTMMLLNNEILLQFEKKGLSINQGVAIDARLVKSASKPISNDEIKKLKKDTKPKFDKNGKPAKFQRDTESNWIVKNNKRHYGLKEHASVDVNNGFILSTTLTPASANESKYLPYCTLTSRHTDEKIKAVYADKGYFGKPNSKFLVMNKIKDKIMRKNTKSAKLTVYEKARNKKISKKRYIVEQYFGLSHLHDKAYRARFTTIAKNIFDTMCRQAAFNIKRGLKLMPAA